MKYCLALMLDHCDYTTHVIGPDRFDDHVPDEEIHRTMLYRCYQEAVERSGGDCNGYEIHHTMIVEGGHIADFKFATYGLLGDGDSNLPEHFNP